MHTLQVPIGSMPVNLILLSNRTLAFARVANFEALLDQPEDKSSVSAFFYSDGFTLSRGEESADFDYNITYKYYEIPMMLDWLIKQNLQLPHHPFTM